MATLMRATWRPLPAWPHPPRKRIYGQRFRTEWAAALDDIEREIAMMGGNDVLIGVVVDESAIGISGQLRAGGRTRFGHRGVELSFDVPKGPRHLFFTDAYDDVGQNLRAISLGLAALRAVDRYGITSGAEQYAGFAQLTAGGPSADRGAMLVERAGGLTEALKRHHPDHGGAAGDFADVQAYRKRAGF